MSALGRSASDSGHWRDIRRLHGHLVEVDSMRGGEREEVRLDPGFALDQARQRAEDVRVRRTAVLVRALFRVPEAEGKHFRPARLDQQQFVAEAGLLAQYRQDSLFQSVRVLRTGVRIQG